MRLVRYLLLALLTATACSESAPFDLGAPISQECPLTPEAGYFPSDQGGPNSDFDFDSDMVVRRAYSRTLAAMQEPSMSCGATSADEAYRFLWLPSWNDPVSIRIFRRGDHYGLEAVVLKGSRGQTEEVLERVTKDLSAAQWRRFTRTLVETGFWQSTTTLEDTLGNDGAQWIIEGQRAGRYHFVDRWGGSDRVAAVEPLGVLLIEFSELNLGHVY